MSCCTLLYVHFSIAIILMGKKELVALLNLSSWCFVMVEWLFLAVPWGCLQFVIVVFPDHTHLLFLLYLGQYMRLWYLLHRRLAMAQTSLHIHAALPEPAPLEHRQYTKVDTCSAKNYCPASQECQRHHVLLTKVFRN